MHNDEERDALGEEVLRAVVHIRLEEHCVARLHAQRAPYTLEQGVPELRVNRNAVAFIPALVWRSTSPVLQLDAPFERAQCSSPEKIQGGARGDNNVRMVRRAAATVAVRAFLIRVAA